MCWILQSKTETLYRPDLTVPPDAHHLTLVRVAGFNAPSFMEKRLVVFAMWQLLHEAARVYPVVHLSESGR